jgi:hypothetical protein
VFAAAQDAAATCWLSMSAIVEREAITEFEPVPDLVPAAD